MSDYLAAIKSRYPLIWITTDEPRSILASLIVNKGERNLYRFAQRGLERYMDEEGEWRIVLGPDPSPDALGEDDAPFPQPVTQLGEAIGIASKEQAIISFYNAHLDAKMLIGFYQLVVDEWLNAFESDNLDDMGATLVLMSYSDEIPPEIRRCCWVSSGKLPTLEELEAITEQISTHGELNINPERRRKIARAGQGLSHAEFVSVTTQTLATHNEIDENRIANLKIHTIAKSGNLEIRVPKFDMNSVGGLDNAKVLLERNAYLYRHPEFCEQHKIEPLARVVLVGISGSGKSLLAEASASSLGLDLATFNVSSMMSKFVGDSEQNMRKAFEQIAALNPVVLWTDEIGRDFSGGQSSSVVDGGVTDRVHGILLSGLQELPKGVFWVGAANSLAALPPEMLRSGRIDQLLFIGFPTVAEREEIFRIHLGDRADAYDIGELARRTPLFTGAEIQTLIKHVRFHVAGGEHRMPTTRDFVNYVPAMKARVWKLHKEDIVAMYRQAIAEWSWASSAQEAEAEFILEAAKSEEKKSRNTGQKQVTNLSDLTSKV